MMLLTGFLMTGECARAGLKAKILVFFIRFLVLSPINERIKKRIYGTRYEARIDIFDYVEMFYSSKRRHGSSEQIPPAEYENLYYQRLRSI